GALFTEDDDRLLLVSFENARDFRQTETALPMALVPAGQEGWSQLCLYADGETWFRDPAVYGFFDDLVDDGFFDNFDAVLFYGAGAGGYAAAAFSVAAPGARVFAIRPQATLDPSHAGWDARFLRMRRADFTTRYGFAPAMVEAAEQVTVLYDPYVTLDRIHAALFTAPNVQALTAPFAGADTEFFLDDMKILAPAIREAGKGRLDARFWARLWRQRQSSPAYLRAVLDRLERQDRPALTYRWCRSALQVSGSARFQTGLFRAQDALVASGAAR
ncbi:MAG: phosphoadenosine phosphosulfate reductase, partial [Pseudomonadota bacterium]